MTETDRTLFLLINALSEEVGPLAVFAYAAAKYLIFSVPIGIAFAWVMGDKVQKRASLRLLASVAIAVALGWAIGLVFPVQRPFLEPIGHNLLAHRPSPSFPSNHGLVMFACAWSLLLMSYKWQAVFAAISGLLVAWSRIYLGIHWPFDMAGALLIALVAAWAARRFDRFAGEKILLVAIGAYEFCVLKPISLIRKRLM